MLSYAILCTICTHVCVDLKDWLPMWVSYRNKIRSGLEVFLSAHKHIRTKLIRQLYVCRATGNQQLNPARGFVPHVDEHVVLNGFHHLYRSFRVEEPIVMRIPYPVENVRWIDRQLISTLLPIHVYDLRCVAEFL